MKASHCTEIPAGTALTVRVAQPHEVVAFDAQLASQCLGAALRALPCQRREHFGWGGVEVRNPWRRDALLGEDGSRSRNANLLANAALIRSTLLGLLAEHHPDQPLPQPPQLVNSSSYQKTLRGFPLSFAKPISVCTNTGHGTLVDEEDGGKSCAKRL